MDPRTMYAFDTTAVPWEERLSERIGRAVFRKVLYTDPDNGAEIRLVRSAVLVTSQWQAFAAPAARSRLDAGGDAGVPSGRHSRLLLLVRSAMPARPALPVPDSQRQPSHGGNAPHDSTVTGAGPTPHAPLGDGGGGPPANR